MKKNNLENFCGVLCDKKGTVDGFFQVNKHDVTIIPFGCDNYTVNKCKEDNSPWLYGISDDNRQVAICVGSEIKTSMATPLNLKAEHFKASIILKSCSNDVVNISESGFYTIEFYGGIVDILFNPAQMLDRDVTTGNVLKRNNDEYEQQYNVQVDGDVFSVRYSIDSRELFTWELGKVPDLRNNIHSVVYFNFEEKRQISDIFKYYHYAKCLFQFCSASANVGFGIRLSIKDDMGRRSSFDVKMIEEYDDYAEGRLDIVHVISLKHLGQNAARLFTVLNENKSKPYMQFLPERNKNANRILYTDINDLCISLEGEYSKIKTDRSDDNKLHAKALANKLLNEIEKEACPEVVKKKARDIINTQLKSFLPSLKEKISWLYEQFEVYIKTIASPDEHVKIDIVKAYTLEEFKKKISEFVAMRNKASHGGFEYNDGTEIYMHLELLVYFCILNRAGYSGEESAQILSWLFGYYF